MKINWTRVISGIGLVCNLGSIYFCIQEKDITEVAAWSTCAIFNLGYLIKE